METIGTILTEHSPQCQLRLQISNVISVQDNTIMPPPTDEYSTDSTIQCGIITPPVHPLDSTSSSSQHIAVQLNLDESNYSSKDITHTSITVQDVTPQSDENTCSEPTLLVY